ncbi:MAG: amino acid ABC transporter substrate-binding protein [Oscillospiraceae bacterium]|jgi:polar amino acid transport system substrate-binding protein|nr:amino acid ABC transporter substrate-binding protein [Oscillospiraceae bacterium]
MKRIACLLSFVLCLVLAAGCAPADPGGADVPDVLIVGLDDTFAPMGFRDEAGNLVGFDIDLANAVGRELGIEIRFQPIDWDAKDMELSSRNIDCIWNGMSRTPDREESMTLSKNYLNNRIIIMTNPDVQISSKEQLADFKVGTQAESSALEVVQSDPIYASIEANLSEYRTYDECILDMQAGRIDAMIVDEVLGQYKNSNLATKLNVASADFGDDYYVIGFRKEDTALCAKVEEALRAVKASGEGAEISNAWFGEDLLLDI